MIVRPYPLIYGEDGAIGFGAFNFLFLAKGRSSA